MTAVEIAERERRRWRALRAFSFCAALTCVVMVVVRTDPGERLQDGPMARLSSSDAR